MSKLSSWIGGLLVLASAQLYARDEPYAVPFEVGQRVEITLAKPYRTQSGVRIQVPWTRLDGKETLTLRAGGHSKELAWTSEPGHVLGVLTAVDDAWITLDLGEKRPLLRIPRAAIVGVVPWETLGWRPPGADPLPTGQRVRFVSAALGGRTLTGNLLAIDDETLLVKLAGRAEPLRLRRASVERFEVSRGRRSGAGKGALVGGLSLLVVGALAHNLCGFNPDCEGPPPPTSEDTVTRLASSAAVGAGIGALFGSAFGGERWERVPLSVAVAPQRRGARAALTLRF